MRRAGSVSLENQELLIGFRYDPRRFEAIKRFADARYDKELKRWRLPVVHLEKLLASRLFSERVMSYAFDKREALRQIEACRDRRSAAKRQMRANPFSVPDEDLPFTEAELVFRLAADGRGILLTFAPRESHPRSLPMPPGVHPIGGTDGHWFPAAELKRVLAEARRRGVSFAVGAALAERLAQTAALRAAILAGRSASSQELEACLLTPYLCRCARDGDRWELCGATDEQLRRWFPEARGPEQRRNWAARLEGERALRLVSQSLIGEWKIWLSDECAEFAAARVGRSAGCDPFPDLLLAAVPPSVCWVSDPRGAGLLLADSQAPAAITAAERTHLAAPHPQFPGALYVRPSDEALASFYERISSQSPVPIARSASFVRVFEEIGGRLEQRARCRHFNELRDAPLRIRNAALALQLFPHQRVAVQWLLETPHAFLGDDMGLGKTLSVLTAFQELRSACPPVTADGNPEAVSFLLIVCPNTLVRTWLRECQRWMPGVRLWALPDTPSAKRAMLERLVEGREADGLVVNYENVRLDYVSPQLAALCANRPVMLCLDESQRVKNPASKTCKALRRIAPGCRRRVLLSGTPTPRDLCDIWSQMLLLDDGKRLGRNYYTWLGTVAEIGNQWSEFAVRRFIPEAVAETIARVQELLLRRRKEQVLDLPEKLFSVRDIELSGDQRRRYEEVRKELLLRVSAIDGTTFTRQIESILEEYLRAVQIASNPRIIDEQWSGTPAKFLELDAIVQEIVAEQGGKVVVWTNFRRNVEELVTRYAEHGAEPFYGDVPAARRQAIIEEFQSPEGRVRMLIAIPAAGGVGITLTAAQTAVYLDKTWNAEHWQQSVDRLHRIGQRGTVHIISLHASPVDALIARSLRRKMRVQAVLLGDHGGTTEAGLPSREELLQAVADASKNVR